MIHVKINHLVILLLPFSLIAQAHLEYTEIYTKKERLTTYTQAHFLSPYHLSHQRSPKLGITSLDTRKQLSLREVSGLKVGETESKPKLCWPSISSLLATVRSASHTHVKTGMSQPTAHPSSTSAACSPHTLPSQTPHPPFTAHHRHSTLSVGPSKPSLSQVLKLTLVSIFIPQTLRSPMIPAGMTLWHHYLHHFDSVHIF